jgi:F0F1-type ATP synthase assembly protein I
VNESEKRADGEARETGSEKFSVERSAKTFQDNITRAGPVAVASYTLIGAIVLLGAIGYALDRWLGASPWFLIVGLLVGIAVGFNELAKTVWKR